MRRCAAGAIAFHRKGPGKAGDLSSQVTNNSHRAPVSLPSAGSLEWLPALPWWQVAHSLSYSRASLCNQVCAWEIYIPGWKWSWQNKNLMPGVVKSCWIPEWGSKWGQAMGWPFPVPAFRLKVLGQNEEHIYQENLLFFRNRVSFRSQSSQEHLPSWCTNWHI